MVSTLRRLSLTVQKRRRLAGGGGGKAKGGKKRTQGESSSGGGAGVTASLFDKGSGDPIEVRVGWGAEVA